MKNDLLFFRRHEATEIPDYKCSIVKENTEICQLRVRKFINSQYVLYIYIYMYRDEKINNRYKLSRKGYVC